MNSLFLMAMLGMVNPGAFVLAVTIASVVGALYYGLQKRVASVEFVVCLAFAVWCIILIFAR